MGSSARTSHKKTRINPVSGNSAHFTYGPSWLIGQNSQAQIERDLCQRYGILTAKWHPSCDVNSLVKSEEIIYPSSLPSNVNCSNAASRFTIGELEPPQNEIDVDEDESRHFIKFCPQIITLKNDSELHCRIYWQGILWQKSIKRPCFASFRIS